jgi:methylated-DNA-[protein]-cysteine S-methyltransferase
MIQIATVDSPIGPLTLAAHDGRVCTLHFAGSKTDLTSGDWDLTPGGRVFRPGIDPAIRRSLERWYPDEAIEEHPEPAGASLLRAYFAGDLGALDAIDVEMNGTAFQQRVWAALRHVKAGTTASYAEIAREIGAPNSVRAVGAANGANPVAVIVPCHRIIGTNGSLTGYGGGLERKQWLLGHEGGRFALRTEDAASA